MKEIIRRKKTMLGFKTFLKKFKNKNKGE